jgi:hypothetical protein
VPNDLVEYLKLLLSPTPDLRWVTSNCSAALRICIRLFGGIAHSHQIVCLAAMQIRISFFGGNTHKHQIVRRHCAFASDCLAALHVSIKLFAAIALRIKLFAAMNFTSNCLRQLCIRIKLICISIKLFAAMAHVH